MTTPVTSAADLAARRCSHGAAALDAGAIAALLPALPGWSVEDNALRRQYAFRDYHETIAFVNALAWIVHQEDHHPVLSVSYRHCTVAWTTHSAGNRLSDNDFLCAAKADALYAGRTGTA